ncbi:MAG: 23S rRNA (pseudouridine(1915)-N(3))-methyltransferase RlmH [Erysipelotrichaceae bacterium]
MIRIIGVGKIKDCNLSALIEDYKKKINRYHKIEIIEVKDEAIRDNDAEVLKTEGERVLKLIDSRDYVIVLDLHGKQMDSIKFARHIDELFIANSRIVFVVGGSLGLSDKLVSRADERLKLSEMTFLHSMTRLILIEQIYRAFKILGNETYHK